MMNDNITNIIEYIKKNNNLSLNELELNIKHNFLIKDINQKSLLFLIDLVLKNPMLLSDTIFQIFINSQKKVNYKIAIQKDETQFTLDTINTYNALFLDIFSNLGLIYILPKQIILLWNESAYSQKFNINTSTFKSNINTDANTSLIIKYVNYDIINSNKIEFNDNDKIFNNYLRKIGLKQYKFGFQTDFQLAINIDIETIFLSIHDIYKGNIKICFQGKEKEFELTKKNDLTKILVYFKKEIIFVFKRHLRYALQYLYLFIEDDIFNNYLDIIFNVLNISINFIEKKIYKQKINFTNLKLNNNIFIVDPCEHEEILNNFYINVGNDYFNKLNQFIQDYITYDNGIAICKICHENIPSLFIKENLYFDRSKYIVNINNDILNYEPYNKFINAKNYFENIFYLFNYYTKLNFNIDNNFIIRLCLDFFIKINTQRLELEYKYKKDINDENIFFLRLSSNFFELDLEKEKYQDKKNIFTYYPIFIVILSTLSIHDYDDFIFSRKQLNITKFNKAIHNLVFEDILVLYIDFLFKKFDINYYNENNKFLRIKRTISIYYDLFQEELQYIYLNKKRTLENFLKKKTQITQKIEIFHYEEFLKEELISLLDTYSIKKQIDTQCSIYQYAKLSINSKIIDNYIPIYTHYDKINNIIYIDFNSFNKKQFNQSDLLQQLNNEFESEHEFYHLNTIYNIKPINDNDYLLYNDNDIIIKSKEELFFLTPCNNNYIFNFFSNNDIYIYKNNINYLEFIDILYNFIIFLKNFFNINIKTNMLFYFNHTEQKIYTRSNLFYYKIEILSIIKNFLNIDDNFINNRLNFEK